MDAVETGAQVEVRFPAIPDLVIPGEVVKVGKFAVPVIGGAPDGPKEFEVEVLLPEDAGAAQALRPDDWRALAQTAQAEGEAVLDAAGLARVPTAELLERVSAVRVAPVDGQRREGGSTWQSHALGKPMETPYLEGAMAALASEVGVPAPVNAALAEAASALWGSR